MLQTFGLEREGQQIGGCDDHAQGEMSRLIIIYWAKNSSFYHSWSYLITFFHILPDFDNILALYLRIVPPEHIWGVPLIIGI